MQTVVNKYGALVRQIEATLVQFFNYRFEHPGDKKIADEDISKYAQRLDTVALNFRESGKKPSELLNERLSELVQFIDGLVMVARAFK